MTNPSASLESLKQQALGSDTEAAHEAFESLTTLGTEEVVQFYLGLLETAERGWRNRGGYGFGASG